jgi:hypothetical protein
MTFGILSAVAIASVPWLIVFGLVAHGLKDLWQHRTQFVANTRWWPPFCFVVDVVAAALTAAVLWTGFDLRGLVTAGNPASAEERAKMMLPRFAPEEVKQCAIDFSAPAS